MQDYIEYAFKSNLNIIKIFLSTNFLIMQISQEHLDEFKRIYKDKFWKDLSDKDALDMATSLLNFVKIIVEEDKK